MGAPIRRAGLALAIGLAAACSGEEETETPTPTAAAALPSGRESERTSEQTPEGPSEQATLRIKRYVDARVAELVEAAAGICAAAPAPDADGWSAAADRDAVTRMRARWRAARQAYERVEGAIAILFPQYDLDVDGRYEHHAELGADPAPFDGRGFIGMHAIERVLWADAIAAPVDDFERALPGYAAPATPADEAEARAFVDGLCARLVEDVSRMQRELRPLALDPQTAWRGIQGSIEEQAEKVRLGATGQDESRYAQTTLADMRANLEGGRAVLDAYAPLIEESPGARAARPRIDARMRALEDAYEAIDGDALPPVPDGFDPDHPRDADLATPYGGLFTLLSDASDPRVDGSLAASLREAGDAMGIPPLGR